MTVMTSESVLVHDGRHRSVESHLIALARKHGLTVRGVSDKIDALAALNIQAARTESGDRTSTPHSGGSTPTTPRPARTTWSTSRRPRCRLSRPQHRASIWRDGARCTMIPRLSSSLDALRAFIRDTLPGWGCALTEPGGDCAPDARPSATMWYGGRAIGPQAARTLELAAFRVTLGALLAHESRLPGDG